MSTHILVLESSTSVCGVALLSLQGESQQLRVRTHAESGEHAERILPMVEALLDEAQLQRSDLSAVAFGQGPGGFTGLRVACGVAQGIAFALGLPVIPVPSLRALLADVTPTPNQLEVVALDARMNELYVAAFPNLDPAVGWELGYNSLLIDAQHLPKWLHLMRTQQGAQVVQLHGDIPRAFPELMPQLQSEWLRVASPTQPTVQQVARVAQQLYALGHSVAPELAAPLYVRDKVAFTTAERQHGAGGNPAAVWRPELQS